MNKSKTEIKLHPKLSYIYGRFMFLEKTRYESTCLVLYDTKNRRFDKIRFNNLGELSILQRPASVYQIIGIQLTPTHSLLKDFSNLGHGISKYDLGDTSKFITFTTKKNTAHYIGDFYLTIELILNGSILFPINKLKPSIDSCFNNFEETTKELRHIFKAFDDITCVSNAYSCEPENFDTLSSTINDDFNNEITDSIQIESFNDVSGTFIDTRNNQKYKWVKIGDQIWMAENLNVGLKIVTLYDQRNNEVIEKYCFKNFVWNCDKHGGLYQWDEIMNYDANNKQGICPKGWHIPIDREWIILEGTVDDLYDINNTAWETKGRRGYDAGEKLKSKDFSANNANTSSKYEFNVIPSGMLTDKDLLFWGLKDIACFWTATTDDEKYVWSRRFDHNDGIKRIRFPKENGFSVRCLKD